MKRIIILSGLGLCSLPFVVAEELPANELVIPKEGQFVEGLRMKPAEIEPETEAIPAKYAALKTVCLKLEKRTKLEGGDFEALQVRLINPSKQDLHFTGYSEKSPWYNIQIWRDGKWTEHKVGWFCGTGLRPCVIAAGKSSVIDVSVKLDLYPIRVGVAYSTKRGQGENETVWSEKIEK